TRFADAWIRSVSARPPERLVEALALAGFAGLVVDRRGYPDGGAAVDAQPPPLTGAAVAETPDHRYAWYPLGGASRRPRAAPRRRRCGRGEAAGWQREAALAPPL